MALRPDIFISYRRDSAAIADQVDAALTDAGLRVWMDRRSLSPGDGFFDAINAALNQARVVLALLGPQPSEGWQKREVETAFHLKQGARPDLGLLLVRLNGGPPDWERTLMGRYQTLDLELAATGLTAGQIALIEEQGRSLLGDGHRPAIREAAPYRGLAAYGGEDAALFFGRRAETLALLRLVADGTGWLQIEGDSGVGKSSLARAGLLPALRSGEPPLRDGPWLCVEMRPGASDPMLQLAKALDRVEAATSASTALIGQLDQAPGNFARFVAGLGRPFALLVDQFEELFSLGEQIPRLPPQPYEAAAYRGWDPQRRFIASLLVALGDDQGSFTLVTTLRGEFFRSIGQVPPLARALNAGKRFLLPAMDPAQLRSAMVTPLQRVGGRFESDALVRTILDDAAEGAERGRLLLLSTALQQCWTRAAKRGDEATTLRLEDYQAAGRVGGALAQMADRLIDRLDAPDRDIARRVLLELVRVQSGAPDVRKPRTLGELEAACGPATRRVINRLSGAARDPGGTGVQRPAQRILFVAATGERGVPESEQLQVEIAHDAMLRDWPALQGWLGQRRAHLEARAELEHAASAWNAARRSPRLLPSEGQAIRFEAILASDLFVTDQARRFLAASRRRRDRVRQLSRERRERQARSEERRLQEQAHAAAEALSATASRSAAAIERERHAEALAAAAAAARIALHRAGPESPNDPRTRVRIAALIRAFPLLERRFLLPFPLASVRASADLSRLLLVGTKGELLVLDPVAGQPMSPIHHAGRRAAGYHADLSPDGRRAAIAATEPDGVGLAVIDLDSGERLAARKLAGVPARVLFDPAGRRILVATQLTATLAEMPALLDRIAVREDWAERGEPRTSDTHDLSAQMPGLAGVGGRLYTLDTDSLEPVADPVDLDRLVRDIQLSRAGDTLLVTHGDRLPPRTYAPATGRFGPLLESVMENVWVAALNRDGDRVVAGDTSGRSQVFEVASGKPITPLLFHGDDVIAAAFDPAGIYVAIAHRTGGGFLDNSSASAVQLHWLGSAGALLPGEPMGPPLRHDTEVTALAWRADGVFLATGGRDGTVRVWDSRSKWPSTPPLPNDGPILHLGFYDAGRRLVSVSQGGSVQLWDLTRNGLGEALDEGFHRRQLAGGWPYFAIDGERSPGDAVRARVRAYWPDRSLYLVGGDADGLPAPLRLLWGSADPAQASRVVILGQGQPIADDRPWSSDGQLGHFLVRRGLLVAAGRRLVLADGLDAPPDVGVPGKLDAHALDRALGVAEPQGHELAAVPTRVRIFDVESGRLLHQIADLPGPIYDIAPTAGGDLVALAMGGEADLVGAGGVWLLPIDDPERRTRLPIAARDLAWDGGGARLSVRDQVGQVRVWSVAEARWDSGAFGPVLHAHRLSPAGDRLATADIQGETTLWDLGSGRILWRRRYGDAAPPRIEIAPDGRGLLVVAPGRADAALGHKRGLAELRDLETGDLRAPPLPSQSLRQALFDASGSMIAGLDDNGRVRIFDAERALPLTPVFWDDLGGAGTLWSGQLTPWSSGGGELVVQGPFGQLRAWSLDATGVSLESLLQRADWLSGQRVGGDGGGTEPLDWRADAEAIALAMDVDPDNASLYAARGRLAAAREDWSGALADLRKAASLGLRDPRMDCEIAESARWVGEAADGAAAIPHPGPVDVSDPATYGRRLGELVFVDPRAALGYAEALLAEIAKDHSPKRRELGSIMVKLLRAPAFLELGNLGAARADFAEGHAHPAARLFGGVHASAGMLGLVTLAESRDPALAADKLAELARRCAAFLAIPGLDRDQEGLEWAGLVCVSHPAAVADPAALAKRLTLAAGRIGDSATLYLLAGAALVRAHQGAAAVPPLERALRLYDEAPPSRMRVLTAPIHAHLFLTLAYRQQGASALASRHHGEATAALQALERQYAQTGLPGDFKWARRVLLRALAEEAGKVAEDNHGPPSP